MGLPLWPRPRRGARRYAQPPWRQGGRTCRDERAGIAGAARLHHLEQLIDDHKLEVGATLDTELAAEDWQTLVASFKDVVASETGKPFPQDPQEQLWGAIGAVFGSWNNARAITYRRLHNIPE